MSIIPCWISSQITRRIRTTDEEYSGHRAVGVLGRASECGSSSYFVIVLVFMLLRLPFTVRGDETVAGQLQTFLSYSLGAVGTLLGLASVVPVPARR